MSSWISLFYFVPVEQTTEISRIYGHLFFEFVSNISIKKKIYLYVVRTSKHTFKGAKTAEGGARRDRIPFHVYVITIRTRLILAR